MISIGLPARLQQVATRLTVLDRLYWFSAKGRFACYALILVALGAWANFTGLRQGMFLYDEASFAYTTDTMLLTHDWVVPYINARRPHLNATPLNNWLSCMTAGWTGDGALRYRLWPALFGIGCVLATLILGTLLFRVEVGFLAGLILQLNHHLLFCHGFRCGVMEAGLTFFLMACVICYVRTYQSPGRAVLWWVLFGIGLGGALLIKPPAMAGFYFCVICALHGLTQRDLSLWARARGPLIGLAVGGLIALPWYAALCARLGTHALWMLFIFNSVVRGASGEYAHKESILYYVQWMWESSALFKLALPAIGFALACAAMQTRRRAWGLPAVLSGALLIALSCAATKYQHYIYSAYPLMSVLIAGVLLFGLESGSVLARRWPRVRPVVILVGVMAAVLLARLDFRTIRKELLLSLPEYPAIAFQDAMRADIESGRAHLVLYRYPEGFCSSEDKALGFTEADQYYERYRLPAAVRVRSVEEVNELLSDSKPMILCLPPKLADEELVKGGLRWAPDHILRIPACWFTYPVLTFHDAERRCALPMNAPASGK